jgi:folate-dependent phosphoribosylglycinamide formyltransferase PurN
MKLFLLLSNEIKQRFVVRELAKHHPVCGVVIEDKYTPKRRVTSFVRSHAHGVMPFVRAVLMKIRMLPYEARERRTIRSYFYEGGRPIPFDPAIPVHYARDINGEDALSLVRRYDPDALVVFGTSLLKGNFLSRVSRPIINVHTGLSPYYRGGQAAFWALYNDEPQYIGVTIHYINAGIDAGNILLQGRPALDADDTLSDIECKLAQIAPRLLHRALAALEAGTGKNVRQAGAGKLFLSRMFTLDKRLALEKMMSGGLLRRYLAREKISPASVRIVDEDYHDDYL